MIGLCLFLLKTLQWFFIKPRIKSYKVSHLINGFNIISGPSLPYAFMPPAFVLALKLAVIVRIDGAVLQ